MRARLGHNCDVFAFTCDGFIRPADTDEPIVCDILADGIALIGTMPRMQRGGCVMGSASSATTP